jgi:flagellar capping protein FliD
MKRDAADAAVRGGASLSAYTFGNVRPVVVFNSGRAPRLAIAPVARLTLGQLVEDAVGRSQRVNLARFNRQHLAAEFEDQVSGLKNALDGFHLPAADDLYRAKGVVSSNENAISGQATTEATLTAHRVRFDQPARAQQNRSVDLTPTDAPSLSEGAYTFELTVGAETHTVEVEVLHSGYTGQADTNLSLLGKIARQINAADERLSAEVVQAERPAYSSLAGGGDLTEKVVYLTITARDTGDEAAFTLTDETGDLIETLGLSRQIPSASRAIWQLGGVGQDGPDNDPEIDSGQVTLHLKTPVPDYQTLTVTQGKTAVLADVSQVLGGYNALLAFLVVNRDEVASNLADTLRREALFRKTDLADIGLEVSDRGFIAVDDQFLTALDTKYAQVQEAVSGRTGLFPALSKLVNDLDRRGADRYLKAAETTPAYSASNLALSLTQTREGYSLLSLIA